MRYLITFLIFCSCDLYSQPCSVLISTSPEHCGQICNGEAQATPTGQGPFTYLWQPSGQTTALATGLCPGSYTVTVVDSAGCITVDSATVINVPPLVVWISNVTDPTCVGCSDGCAVGNASGGSPSYVGMWSPPPIATMSFCGMSDSVTYTFCVTDANGCIVCADTSVNDPVGLEPIIENFQEEYSGLVFDAAGKLVWSCTRCEFETSTLAALDLPNGIYFYMKVGTDGLILSDGHFAVLH